MKHLMIILVATVMTTGHVFAEDRAVATVTEAPLYSEVPQYEVATFEFSARSFFEPKTEADLNALASLSNDLESSLAQEELN